jgi:hypothetical protein
MPKSMSKWSLPEFFCSVTHFNGVLEANSGEEPLWVECPDWPELERALRDYDGVEAKPADWAIERENEPRVRVELPEGAADAPIPAADPERVARAMGEMDAHAAAEAGEA